jgi:hypothetical protein
MAAAAAIIAKISFFMRNPLKRLIVWPAIAK